MRISQLISMTFAAALFIGCTPSPEKVCGKFNDLAMPELEKMAKAFGKELSADDKDKMKSKCTTEMEKMKAENADEYKKVASCVMDAKEFKDLEKCDLKKGGKKDKKGDDDKADKKDDKKDDK
jgi:hypothetical protein